MKEQSHYHNPVSTATPESARASLGFRDAPNGPHAARTMMLEDVAILFQRTSPKSGKVEYASEVLEGNCLGKPTRKARELAFRYLAALYGLNPEMAVFRVFRTYWEMDEKARPVLALCIALARDPLLRSTQAFVLSKQNGEAVPRHDLEDLLTRLYPDRFSPASTKSFAQNVSGTWSQAGFLKGRTPKYRRLPVVTPTNVAFSLFLGYLEGLSGQRLFGSSWVGLLGCLPDDLDSLTSIASQRGLLVFMNAGGVKEVRFPGYLTQQEEQWRQEVSNVQ